MFLSCPNSNVASGDRVRVRLGMCPSPTLRYGTCVGWRRVGRVWECVVKYDGIRNVRFMFHPAHVCRVSEAGRAGSSGQFVQ